MTNLVRCSF